MNADTPHTNGLQADEVVLDEATGTDLVVNPATGEALDLKKLDDPKLVDVYERAVDLAEKLNAHGRFIQEEVIARLDSRNERKGRLEDGTELNTNAATSDEYPVKATREALERLVAAGILDESVVGKVIVYPPAPPAPPPRVDKREINKLKNHPNDAVARELGTARERVPQRRTLKVERPTPKEEAPDA